MINSVSIIIPNFNGESIMPKHLLSVVKALENKKNNIQEIIIIDDKSTDNSLDFLLKNFKDKIRLIKHTKNRGFSATVNTGARAAKSELLCLLNTDVSVTEDFLQFVLPHFGNEKVFGVSLHEKGFGPAGASFKGGFINFIPGKETDKATNSFWISGGSGVFKRSIWMKLGGLDEKLLSPFYWEDVDLSYRAQKRGYKLLWEPNAKVVHEHEAVISKLKTSYVLSIRQRNELLTIWKNITSQRIFRKHIQGLLKRILRHPGYARIFLLALLKFGLVSKLRRREKKDATISDEAIFAKFS